MTGPAVPDPRSDPSMYARVASAHMSESNTTTLFASSMDRPSVIFLRPTAYEAGGRDTMPSRHGCGWYLCRGCTEPPR